jgi:hypothetical protein
MMIGDEDALRPQPSFDLRGCGVSGIVPNVIPLSFLTFEKRAKGDGDLQVHIALVSRRKCPRIAAMGRVRSARRRLCGRLCY